MNEAAFYSQLEPGGAVRCALCPRRCRIEPGGRGFCRVRENRDGMLIPVNYALPVALQIDPIEKKPLAEFLPGSKTFSLGTFGCNLRCEWCQNSELARGQYDPARSYQVYPASEIIEAALRHGCRSVAFTYNEPTVFFEYALDVARLAHEAKLATVLVSNGYITPEAMAVLYAHIDAANIDMKGFDAAFYREKTGGELADVLRAAEYLHRTGKHLELTNLVIPGYNDAPEWLERYLDWVESALNRRVPLHFSAYFPCGGCHQPPTPAETLYRIRDRAEARGFTSVYVGNIR